MPNLAIIRNRVRICFQQPNYLANARLSSPHLGDLESDAETFNPNLLHYFVPGIRNVVEWISI